MSEISDKVDSYFSLKSDISDFFEVNLWDGLDDYRHQDWEFNGDEEVRFMDEDDDYDPEVHDDGMTYAAEVNYYKRRGGLVLVNVRTCTGDGNANYLFNEDNEVDLSNDDY